MLVIKVRSVKQKLLRSSPQLSGTRLHIPGKRRMSFLTHAVFVAMVFLAALASRWGHQRQFE